MPPRNLPFVIFLIFWIVFLLAAEPVLAGNVTGTGLIANSGKHEDSLEPGSEGSIRVLNNFVFELLAVASPERKRLRFQNPRDGWIFIAITGPETLQAASVLVDEREYALRRVGEHFEAMEYLSDGQHVIKVPDGIKADTIVVRAVPELFYNMYGHGPLVQETGSYSWDWLRVHVLDHYNSIIGTQHPEAQTEEIKAWIRRDGRWYTQSDIPWVDTVKAVYDYWTKEPGMSHPLLHGMWIDEFAPQEKYEKMLPVWGEALRRIHKDPRFKDRTFYAYMGPTYDRRYDVLTKTIVKNDGRLAQEWYLNEQPDEEKALASMSLPDKRKDRDKFDAVCRGAARNRVVVLSLLSQPEESCDIYPHVNYNVFLDLQLQLLANDPAFVGIRGLQGYYSAYAGEEQTRLFARLVRHYAIEGKRNRMLADPYILTHLKNPDFVEGTSGWLLFPSYRNSIIARRVDGFGWLQGRYDRSGNGDTVLWTKRSKDKPNVFAQEIRDLQPGRLYSLRFFTGNYQDYVDGKSRDCNHAISVRIDDVDLIPQKSFQAKIKSNYGHTFKSFNKSNPYRLNYHQVLFRARREKAELAFSDWSSTANPGGPEGEELIWNFIQIQPYFDEDENTLN